MSEQELYSLLSVLKVLADDSRLRMIGLLATAPRSGVELAELLELRAATVSHHLARLREVGLVSVRREGATRSYSLDTDALSELRERLLAPERMAEIVSAAQPESPRSSVLSAFLEGEVLRRIPASRKKRDVVLQWLAERFPLDTHLSEPAVNEQLQRHHWDCATLRRELVGGGWMTREAGVYRRVR